MKASKTTSSWLLRLSAGALALGLVVASPGAVRGAGFQINEHSARATGMASSVVATVGDPSAIFHNPAGLTRIEGTEFQAGLNLIVPHGDYSGPGLVGTDAALTDSQDLVNDPVPVPYVYAARQLSELAYVGLGFYLPYGSGLEWRDPEAFVGRTQLTELALRTYYFTPTVAIRFNDVISVAVSASLVPATLLLSRDLGATDTQEPLFAGGGSVDVSGTAFGVGANAGVQLHLVNDHLQIGLNYRSAVNLSFSGDANFTVPENLPLELRANFPDQNGSGEITIPHAFSLGIGWVQGPLTIEAGAQLTLWESYDELRLRFDTGRPAASSASPRNWENVALFRLGGQYTLGAAAIRLGVGYDISPIPDSTADFTLPDNDRFYYSVGAGYDFGPLRADVAYMGLWLTERVIPASTADEIVNVNLLQGGTFNGGFAHVMSLSLGTRI